MQREARKGNMNTVIVNIIGTKEVMYRDILDRGVMVHEGIMILKGGVRTMIASGGIKEAAAIIRGMIVLGRDSVGEGRSCIMIIDVTASVHRRSP